MWLPCLILAVLPYLLEFELWQGLESGEILNPIFSLGRDGLKKRHYVISIGASGYKQQIGSFQPIDFNIAIVVNVGLDEFEEAVVASFADDEVYNVFTIVFIYEILAYDVGLFRFFELGNLVFNRFRGIHWGITSEHYACSEHACVCVEILALRQILLKYVEIVGARAPGEVEIVVAEMHWVADVEILRDGGRVILLLTSYVGMDGNVWQKQQQEKKICFFHCAHSLGL